MKFVESFGTWTQGVTSELISRLDRNFRRLSEEDQAVAVTADFTLKPQDKINSVQVDATAGNVLVYLPSSPTGTRRYTMTKTDSSANWAVLDGNGSLINGASQQALGSQYDSITVEPTGTGWIIVACVP